MDADHEVLDETFKDIVGSVRSVTSRRVKYVDLEQLIAQWREGTAWMLETSLFITLIQACALTLHLRAEGWAMLGWC